MSWFNYFDSAAVQNPQGISGQTVPTYTTQLGQQGLLGVIGTTYPGQYLGQQGMQNYPYSGTITATAPYQPTWTQLTEDDLANEAFNTPIETLVNLWLARYGDAWIDKTNVISDKFFEIAAQRLIKLSRMEEYSIIAKNTPSYKTVLRVVA